MKNLEISNCNLLPLSKEEALMINGGGWKKDLWDHTIGWIVGEVIDGVGRGLTAKCPTAK